MHYYKRNLGDYAKKAGRLSMLQHGAYTLLLDSCYDREQFPTLEEAIDWTWASSKEEVEAVEFVLKKFFVLESGVYVQHRVKEELAEYQAKSETNKRIAEDREAKRKQKAAERSSNSKERARVVHEPSPDDNEPPPNQEPRTINQEPISTPDGVVDARLRDGASDPLPTVVPLPVSLTNQEKFRMRIDWEPGPMFGDRCYQSGLDPGQIPQANLIAILGEFRSYWTTRPDQETHARWEHKFLQQLIRRKSTGDLYEIRKPDARRGVAGIDWNDSSWYDDEFHDRLQAIARGEEPDLRPG